MIESAKHLKRLRIKKQSPLNDVRKAARLRFIRDHMAWVKQCNLVDFSDEKKFNLDGPNGYNYYIHDLRKQERFLNRNHSCADGVMVWGAISYCGTCELQFVSSKMRAITYKGVIEKAFQHFDNIFGPIPWTFQPPYCPELNIIENVWRLLSRKVYEGGKQFENTATLIEVIKK